MGRKKRSNNGGSNSPQTQTTKSRGDMSNLQEKIDKVDVLEEDLRFAFAEISDLKKEVSYLKKVSNLDIGTPEKPATTFCEKKPSELQEIVRSLHITDVRPFMTVNHETWFHAYSHAHLISKLLGGMDGVMIDSIYQLKPIRTKSGYKYPANIVFKNEMYRATGVACLKGSCEKVNMSIPPLHYSLGNFPQLKADVNAISTVLKELKSDNLISWYSLNEFMSAPNEERVAPLFSFRVQDSDMATDFYDCPTINMFWNGFHTPVLDKNHTSPEFGKLKETILQFLQENYDESPSPKEPACEESSSSKRATPRSRPITTPPPRRTQHSQHQGQHTGQQHSPSPTYSPASNENTNLPPVSEIFRQAMDVVYGSRPTGTPQTPGSCNSYSPRHTSVPQTPWRGNPYVPRFAGSPQTPWGGNPYFQQNATFNQVHMQSPPRPPNWPFIMRSPPPPPPGFHQPYRMQANFVAGINAIS